MTQYGRGFCIGLCKAFCSCLRQKNGDIEKLGHIVGVKQLLTNIDQPKEEINRLTKKTESGKVHWMNK